MSEVIPTLYVNKPIIETTPEKVAYLIKQLLYNPGNISSCFEPYLLSSRKAVSFNKREPSIMASAIAAQLNGVLTHHGLSAEVTYTQPEDSPFQCHLIITVKDGGGNLVTQMDDFAISADGQMILAAAYKQDNVYGNQ